MYWYKCFAVLFQPEKNTREAFQLAMMRNSAKHAAHACKSVDTRKRVKTVDRSMSIEI